jgi:hypothetical protein
MPENSHRNGYVIMFNKDFIGDLSLGCVSGNEDLKKWAVYILAHRIMHELGHDPVRKADEEEIKEDDVIALEPFVCEKNGFVKESEPVEIFSFMQPRPVRLPEARSILELAGNEYMGLPFCRRWLVRKAFRRSRPPSPCASLKWQRQ